MSTRKRRRETYDTLRNAQRRRQAILDYLHAYPSAMFIDIAAHMARLGWPVVELRGTLAGMRQRREITYAGRAPQYAYTALVDVTRSADAIIDDARRKNRDAYRQRAAQRVPMPRLNARVPKSPPPKTEPWLTVHKAGESNNKNAGGQGAVRPRVHVNCQQHY